MESKNKTKIVIARPFRPRGTGLKITICHQDDQKANYWIEANSKFGTELFRDKEGYIYTLACKYDMVIFA